MKQVDNALVHEMTKLEEIKRQVEYSLSIHEPSAAKDQSNLAIYIELLENAIERASRRRHQLTFEVGLLEEEVTLMREGQGTTDNLDGCQRVAKGFCCCYLMIFQMFELTSYTN